ncbi:NirD/YgiW/YdeI family stress tolerance protein [Breznakiella homolactica]|uniref:NirD/YgiW/YdeI family stress tolerance protein n=1 Tax=Breznakiella homolactica TaxID=2798577 RepID=A0A7T7XR47_9SPIR|nr:NirD/YgiW/YdeI family stress tolerance protein [Breznakiella homolactica]QQO10960.1 NirD/YgiW/YdeI family stress tolerance protein [Breznakiella homolactica]
MKKTGIIAIVLLLAGSIALSAQGAVSIESARQMVNGPAVGPAPEPPRPMPGPAAGRIPPVPPAPPAHEKQWVTVQGTLEPLIQAEYYRLADATGDLLVKIKNDKWRGLMVKAGDTVLVSGNLSWKKEGLVLDAKFIQKGDTPAEAATVSQSIQLPDHSWVVLRGRISQGITKDRYIFSDSSGDIAVKITDGIWRGLMVRPGDTITIHGEIDRDKRTFVPEVKVEYIEM